MWDKILDALVDSAKALPFLLLIYFLIEFLEQNHKAKNKTIKLLNGRFAPLVASGVGLVPQCGFPVMATNLYCQSYLRLGTLIAFYVASSDEALPILLTNSQTAGVVWIVLLVKLLYAVVLGYLVNLFDRRALNPDYDLSDATGCCHHELDEHEGDGEAPHAENPQTTRTKWQRFRHFAGHPVLHSIKMFLYIFVVNSVFGVLMFYAEQSITDFVGRLGFFQGFFTAAIGLVPNCASSVILAEMFSQGIIELPALLAGLVSDCGIALLILFREKKPLRNLAVVGILYAAGVLAGALGYLFAQLL